MASSVCSILKGDPTDIQNYRPIIFLYNFARVFKVYNRIYLLIRNIIFINTNLICFAQFASQEVEELWQVNVVYMDFSNAFDRVDHLLLSSKLSGHELPTL